MPGLCRSGNWNENNLNPLSRIKWRAAGASLEHSHSQLIALPIVPKRVREEIDGAKQYYDYKERCVYCDIIRQELNAGTRVVSENRDFVAIEPFTPRFPFETWVIPKHHDSCFEDAKSHEFQALAEILQSTLRRIDKVLNVPPYNYIKSDRSHVVL